MSEIANGQDTFPILADLQPSADGSHLLVRDGHATIKVERNGNRLKISPGGVWRAATVNAVDASIRRIQEEPAIELIEIDMENLIKLDTAGAWLLFRLKHHSTAKQENVKLTNILPQHKVLFEAIRESEPETTQQKPTNPITGSLDTLGRSVVAGKNDLIMGLNIIGAAVGGSQMKAGKSGGVRPVSIIHHLDLMGLRAVPVIALMSFLIGAIIAQQGAFQLRFFGAEILVVDLVGILHLREVGVLLTAIMVAGRSGSAITAEIGSMRMREEVDALTVIGLNPIGVLIFPRLVALTIALPLLAFLADITGILGAMAVSYVYVGISPATFISKLQVAVDMSTLFAGLIKAPFMALAIGVVASVEGMQVGGSADSLGRRTTAAVVKAIFLVIVIDGIFAMFYAAIGY